MQNSQLKIGLEVHLYPATKAKMFCSCSANFMEAPQANQFICPVCTSQPGSKPKAINKEALLKGIILARLMNCQIQESFNLLRKHYFYPDNPSNYQRTATPYAIDGMFKNVRIREIHVEEDPGQFDLKKGTVDFNRSGTPLLEMVTEPDLKTAQEARHFLEDLKLLLDFVGLIKPGTTFKVDTNVSTMNGERIEVKNINSIKDVETAILFEEKRQMLLREQGQEIERETRHFDSWSQETLRLRAKEGAADYRYMKDPDLGLCSLKGLPTPSYVDPLELQQKLVHVYDIDEELALHLVVNRFYGRYQEVANAIDPLFAATWFLRDLKPELEKRDKNVYADTGFIIQLLTAIQQKKITPLAAKDLLRDRLDGKDVAIESFSVEDTSLETLADDVLKKHMDAVVNYRKGKATSLNFLVGMVSKELKKKVDANKIRDILEKRLKISE